MTIKLQTLFDFGAYVCIIDKESIGQHKFGFNEKNPLQQKLSLYVK
jgi:hypothetical protein